MFVHFVCPRNFENAVVRVVACAEMTAKMHRNGETLLVARTGHVLTMNINVLKQLNGRRTRGFFAINSQLAICIGDTIAAIRRRHQHIDRKITLR